MTEWARFGATARYGEYFACFAGEIGPGEELSAREAARKLYTGMIARERPVALIAGAERAWGEACEVTQLLIRRTTGKMMKLEEPEWMGVVLEVSGAGRDLILALDGALGDEAERVVIALGPRDPDDASLKLALAIAKLRVGLIVNLFDDADAHELARFQRAVEVAELLKGRGVRLVPRP